MIALPAWAKAALGGVLLALALLAAGTAYLTHRDRVAGDAREQQMRGDAAQERVDTIARERNRGNEIDRLDSDDLLDRLHRWVRP